jgi:hypothetical protein
VGEDIVVEVAPCIEAEDLLPIVEAEIIISPKTLLPLLGQSTNSVARLVTPLQDVIKDRTLLWLHRLLRPTQMLKLITPRLHWYPDTVATHHMTNNLQNLNLSSKEYTGQDQIRIGNGTGLPILHSGFASLSLSNRPFLLQQLLHVPTICKNLLSVHQFALENSLFFEFYSSHFIIKDCKIRRPIHQGQLNNGLYQRFPSKVPTSPSQVFVGERTTSHRWHKRLGHPALRIVNLILSKFQLPVSTNKAHAPCTTCPQAKGHQLPFSRSTTTICNPLDLVYSNV